MRRNGLVAIAAAATALVVSAVPAHAQSWKIDLGVNGGGSFYTPMLSNDQFGGNGDAVKFKPSWLTGGQLTVWPMSRLGIRANMTYTDAKLYQGTDNILHGDINLWSGTGDLMFRFNKPADTFTKMEMLPYIALGAGEKWHNPAANLYWVNDPSASKTWSGVPFSCGTNGVCAGPDQPFTKIGVAAGTPEGAFLVGHNNGTSTNPAGTSSFFLSQEHVFMGLAGLGTDVRLARNFAIRLEAGDRFYKPALIAVTPGASGADAVVTATNSDTKVSKWVHEIYGQVGLQLLLGIPAAPVVAVTPTPAPPPAPAPETPPPPPAPTTSTTSVCVVDPTQATGLRTETATVTLASGDTTVMVNGTATPLRSAFTGVPTATGAEWYVQGKPLTIGTGRNALAYVSFGSARNVDANDLTFVGTINGLPVYANKTDVTSLTIPNPPVDITTNKTLVTGLKNVQVLYVPVSTYGCNFQPIQMQQAVRKVRG